MVSNVTIEAARVAYEERVAQAQNERALEPVRDVGSSVLGSVRASISRARPSVERVLNLLTVLVAAEEN